MSRPMTKEEFASLLDTIDREHNPMAGQVGRKTVSYVHPVFDMRYFCVFAITMRPFGGLGITLHTQNECRNLPESLYERCITWLRSEV